MSSNLTRRSLLKTSSFVLGATLMPLSATAAPADLNPQRLIRLNLNENAFGPSSNVEIAIQREFSRLARYADANAAQAFAELIAAYKRIPVEQIVLGEILGALGLYLGSQGGPGGEFIYSTPGYLAHVDAASHVGGIGVPVPLDVKYENDLPGLAAKINSRTRALYLINPHNPTGTVSADRPFKHFLREASQHVPVIVDEAYLEYTAEFEIRSAVSLVREGVDVLVFRTFDKIHGLAGLPIGYTLAPRRLADTLRKQGAGDAESLGRMNIAAASAALADTAHVARTRTITSSERTKWISALDELKLAHTDSHANFIFFDAGRPQAELAAAFRARNVDIGRTFSPSLTWARITVGLPEENRIAQQQLREVLRDIPKWRLTPDGIQQQMTTSSAQTRISSKDDFPITKSWVCGIRATKDKWPELEMIDPAGSENQYKGNDSYGNFTQSAYDQRA
ncbi:MULTISPECIES: histidinol-phosphate transaminase [Acidobacteriaceae]|uniref:pyridoxal phosphate-dependent aminotransferase n=1 Tax=Acidobacteriaceae TaxID=204434 RepID=UPI001C203A54|nr:MULTISPECIES: histidinol-phosphate transaminase [Acidobacteriaceae]MDW5264668.1 histidinol-phosphate transaminase [Edaphobacter sp.]